jgi:phenylacetate-CoA ligase
MKEVGANSLRILYLAQFMRNQWKSAEELKAIQDKKLRRLVHHAYDRVPYYRRLLDAAAIKPEDIRGVEDLPRIPLTSRQMLMSLPLNEILARGIDPTHCRMTQTSGCTGHPLRIFHRREDLDLINLGWTRTYLNHGFRPWQRMAEFGGRRYSERGKSWYEYLALMRRLILPYSDSMETWISNLQMWQPHALVGFSSTLKLLALNVWQRDIKDIRPPLVFSTSELLENETRQLLHTTFNARVIDIYGSEEGRCIAWECHKCAGYHINTDLVVVEFLKNGDCAPSETDGEIVITNLHSFAMPFIRYRQGDVGALSKGPSTCGRGLPLMSIIRGKLDDFIVLRNGALISPQVFYYALAPLGGVAEWRVIQVEEGEVRVEIVADRGPQRGKHQHLLKYRARKNLRQILGEDTSLVVNLVSCIPRGESEKSRSVVSLVAKRMG